MATYEATRYSITGANILGDTIPAPSIVDGTVSNLEFSYINTLSSNAQTQLTAKASTTGATITGDFDFADDAKARFGDGNDLQIYHDGSNSYIKNGTGYIKFLEDNYQFNNNADSATFLSISSSGLTGVGTGLTALNATNLGSGTVPDARFPATLPAASGANLTSLPAANLTGTAAAINGSNITSLNGTNIASGTVADARISTLTSSKLTGALPAIDGSALTGIATATGAFDSVGSLALACTAASTATGATVAGSNLYDDYTIGTYNSGAGSLFSTAVTALGSSTLTGTWLCLGKSNYAVTSWGGPDSGSQGIYTPGLFVRTV